MKKNNKTFRVKFYYLKLLLIMISVILLFSCKHELTTVEDSRPKTTSTTIGNNVISETDFFEKNKLLGGDVKILKSDIWADGKKSFKTFLIDVPNEGTYYLNTWGVSPVVDGENYVQYDISVNEKNLSDKLIMNKPDWHNASYVDNSLKQKKPIFLKKGINEVIFSCDAPITPSIDFIRLTINPSMSDIEDNLYSNYSEKARINQSNIRSKYSNISDSLDSNTFISHLSTPVLQPSDPLYDFDFYLDFPFKYTYYTTVYFNLGQNINISTSSSSFLHVMEVFSQSNAQAYSWTRVSNSAGSATLNITIPSSGMYYVRLRSYWQDQIGVVNLNINGQYSYQNCITAGSAGKRSYHYANQELNYFTSNSVGDTRIWVEDNSAMPGRIIGYNDDYYGNGDYSWGLNSRIKKNFNTAIGAILVSSYSSYTPDGTTDLYIRCKNSNIMSYFPNLKSDDAIMSSPASSNYNCTAWTGGFTSFWFWGSSPTNYYGNPQIWNTWDNYYGNNPVRYIGAVTYTNDGATAENASIAMWAHANGEITHGSIRKPGNNHAHGYDWESKPGQLMRTFHPRNSLNGVSYGNIVRYYKRAENSGGPPIYSRNTLNKNDLTFEESLKLGLTTIENIELNTSEKQILQTRKALINRSPTIFKTLYRNWVNAITSNSKYSIVSNPYTLICTREGIELSNYSKDNLEEAILFFTEIIFDTDENKSFERNISYYLFCELTKDKYGNLLERIKDDWKKNNYTKDGKYIAPLPETFTKKYIKAILSK